jgi:hypothetical protein
VEDFLNYPASKAVLAQAILTFKIPLEPEILGNFKNSLTGDEAYCFELPAVK